MESKDQARRQSGTCTMADMTVGEWRSRIIIHLLADGKDGEFVLERKIERIDNMEAGGNDGIYSR